MKMMQTDKIKISEPFCSLLGIDPHTLFAIQESMEEVGYDEAFPLVLWNDIVIDGHTRLEAARNLGIQEVPVIIHGFLSELDALGYAFHNQRDRRNWTDADMLRAVELIDKRKQSGERTDLAPSGARLPSKSSTDTAKIIGTSPRKVERTRAVLDDSELAQEVLDGKKSISAASKEAIAKKQETKSLLKPIFNETNDNIEWARWTWNPVTGCKHGCRYCYARDIANRFYPQGFEPTFHENRLIAPMATKQPVIKHIGDKNVFVCSMADLFGEWVPDTWIIKVLDACRRSPQWNYLFLTKNPRRYIDIGWPDNAWVGTTVDVARRMPIAQEVFTKLHAPIKFLSCEPLSEDMGDCDLSMFDWVIIGGQSKSSQMEAEQPHWSWVERLCQNARKAGAMIYFKPNLIIRPKEYPKASGLI